MTRTCTQLSMITVNVNHHNALVKIQIVKLDQKTRSIHAVPARNIPHLQGHSQTESKNMNNEISGTQTPKANRSNCIHI